MSNNYQNTWQIGTIDDKVINILGISVQPGSPIIIGDQNIEHMKREHPDHYAKYGDKIQEIISSPTYLAKHPAKDSIEYIKVYDDGHDHVLVAVRASGNGTIFARTLFIMSDEKIQRYEEKNAFKKYI